MIDLDELEVLVKAATSGPWWIDSHGHEMVNPESMELVFRTDNSMGELTRNEETGNLSRWPNDNDATFIASFNPEVAMELLTRLRQAERDAARYRWLREARDFDSMQHQVFNKSYGFLLDSDIDEAMNGSNN